MASKNKTNSKRKSRPKKPKIKLKKVIDQRLIKALSHPMRAHVFSTLNERVASPRDLAVEVGLDVDYLAYHFRELRDHKCIEEVRREPRRGATEHFYRATTRFHFDNREWERLPATLRADFGGEMFQAIVDEVTGAMKGGSFDARDDKHISWMPGSVDEQGWEALMTLLDETLEQAMAIQAESAERLIATGEEAIPATVAMVGFETSGDPASSKVETAPTGRLPAPERG